MTTAYTRYVALFRGINVGKAKRIAMADLRALLARMGCTEVRTLLNSGNAVFASAADAGELAGAIRAAGKKKLGVDGVGIGERRHGGWSVHQRRKGRLGEGGGRGRTGGGDPRGGEEEAGRGCAGDREE